MLLTLITFLNFVNCNEHKIVTTKNGDIRGVRKSTLLENVDYYSFKGIPYAEPPIGELRFKVYYSLLTGYRLLHFFFILII